MIRRKFLSRSRILKEKAGFMKRNIIAPKMPQNKDGKVYVNLGCGANTSPEFINVDTRAMPNVHYIHEVQKLPMFADNSVDLLYASHLLEHVPRNEVIQTLREWRRVLKPGGVLRFGVPDFDALIEIYELAGRDVHRIESQLLGQNAPYDDHHTIWNFVFAEEILRSAGFGEIRRWDPSKVDHHDFVDKTTRVEKVEGRDILISLNVEAIK